MKLKIPTREQVRQVYRTDMTESFPAAELKPLAAIEQMWAEGWYRPYCLFDGEEVVGEAFLWLGHPGWGLLDYLCVVPSRRNDGLGSQLLQALRAAEPDMVIFGEAEAPVHAPDPAMAERRLGFYARNGLRLAGYDTEMFGVHYKTLYLADREIPDGELMPEHRFVYENSFTRDKFEKYVHIPFDPRETPREAVAWDQ